MSHTYHRERTELKVAAEEVWDGIQELVLESLTEAKTGQTGAHIGMDRTQISAPGAIQEPGFPG